MTIFHFDPDSPLFVAKGTLSLGLVGLLVGGAVSSVQSLNPVTSVTMGLNGSLVGLGFFALREYLVSPILISTLPLPSYQDRLAELQARLQGTPYHAPILTEAQGISRTRNSRVLDSALAAGLFGAGLTAISRPGKSLPKAFFTAALMGTTGQYIVNNGRVFRLEFLAKQQRDRQEQQHHESDHLVTHGAHLTDPVQLVGPQDVPTEVVVPDVTKPTWSQRLGSLLTSLNPVTKMTSQEYLESLTRERRQVELDISSYKQLRSEALQGKTPSLDGQETQGLEGDINLAQAERRLDAILKKVRVLEKRIDAERDA